jgi:hypothetical protein
VLAEPTAREVAIDPRWLPHTYDLSGSMLTSVFVPRESRDDLMFLSDEHFGGEFRKIAQPARDIAAHVGEAPDGPLHFIYHTALCGSTLMAKALDLPGHAHALREPDVLINLANRLVRSDDPGNRDRLKLVLRLLARSFAPGEAVIVKPSNVANRLALLALEARADSRAVLLYSDVRPLLRSILNRGMWGRIWGRRIFASMSSWTSLNLGYSAEEVFILTDLQALALGWLMQIHHFAEVARRMGERVMIVDGADFFGDPAPVLRRVATLFRLGIDDSEIEKIVSGPKFSRHSKLSDRGYGHAERQADQSAAESAHGEELDMVVTWIGTVAARFGIEMRPGAELVARAV